MVGFEMKEADVVPIKTVVVDVVLVLLVKGSAFVVVKLC